MRALALICVVLSPLALAACTAPGTQGNAPNARAVYSPMIQRTSYVVETVFPREPASFCAAYALVPPPAAGVLKIEDTVPAGRGGQIPGQSDTTPGPYSVYSFFNADAVETLRTVDGALAAEIFDDAISEETLRTTCTG